jgi:hypothetical protein
VHILFLDKLFLEIGGILEGLLELRVQHRDLFEVFLAERVKQAERSCLHVRLALSTTKDSDFTEVLTCSKRHYDGYLVFSNQMDRAVNDEENIVRCITLVEDEVLGREDSDFQS